MAGLVPGLIIGVVVLAAMAAREAWCHWYYPVRGRLYLECRQPELAASAWECYLGTWTVWGARHKLVARYALSQCYWALGRHDDALQQCEAIVARWTDSPLARLARRMQADCLEELGESDAAAAARSASTPVASPDDDGRFAKSLEVERLERAGDWFAALELLHSLAEDTLHAHRLDEHLQLRLRLAKLRLRLGRAEDALTGAEGLLARTALPSDLEHDAHHTAARAALSLGKLDQAERDARAAFRIANLASNTEQLVDDCMLLAELAMHRCQYVEAMHQLRRVRECHGRGLWMAPLGEAEVLRLWGRDTEAALALEHAARRVPRRAGDGECPALLVAMAIAEVLSESDAVAALAAMEPYLHCHVRDPRLAVGHAVSAGLALTLAGRHDEAAAHWRRVSERRELLPGDRPLQTAVDVAEGRRAMAEGRPADAAEAYGRALERPAPLLWRPIIERRLGTAYEAAGLPSAAIESYRAAARFAHPIAAQVAAQARLAELDPS